MNDSWYRTFQADAGQAVTIRGAFTLYNYGVRLLDGGKGTFEMRRLDSSSAAPILMITLPTWNTELMSLSVPIIVRRSIEIETTVSTLVTLGGAFIGVGRDAHWGVRDQTLYSLTPASDAFDERGTLLSFTGLTLTGVPINGRINQQGAVSGCSSEWQPAYVTDFERARDECLDPVLREQLHAIAVWMHLGQQPPPLSFDKLPSPVQDFGS